MGTIMYMDKEYAGSYVGLIDFFYPIGCYFETSDTSFDPNVSWGGTWEEDDAGLVLVSAGTADGVTYVTDDTGGSKDAIAVSHSHGIPSLSGATSENGWHQQTGTVSWVGDHVHDIAVQAASVFAAGTNKSGYVAGTGKTSYGGGGHNHTFTTDGGGSHTHTISTDASTTNTSGSSGQNANMQPYKVVKRWHRVA